MSTNVVLTVVNKTEETLKVIPDDVHVNWFHNPAKSDIYNNLGTVNANSSASTPPMTAYGSDNSVIAITYDVVTSIGTLRTGLAFNLVQADESKMTVFSCPSAFRYSTNVSNESGSKNRVFTITFEPNE